MYLFLLIIIAFLLIVVLTFFLVVILRDQVIIRVPFIPTRKRVLSTIINSLELSKDSTLYDLGCGDARILIEAVKHTPGITGIGIEYGFLPYIIAKTKTLRLPLEIKYGNIFNLNLSKATHIYCYLSPELMQKLSAKIKLECATGTRIVSCDFQFSDWVPVETIPVETKNDSLGKTLYIYIK